MVYLIAFRFMMSVGFRRVPTQKDTQSCHCFQLGVCVCTSGSRDVFVFLFPSQEVSLCASNRVSSSFSVKDERRMFLYYEISVFVCCRHQLLG